MAERTESQIMAEWQGTEKPVITVLCLTFNHAPYIAQALEGFLMQETSFPFEIVVYNDASTDETTAIVERYRERYPRLIRHIVNERNQFSQGERVVSLALSHTRGEYVAY